MFKFILGVLVGAAGYWGYRFWKGEDDTSWDQSWSSTGPTGTSYGSQSSEPVSAGGSMSSGSMPSGTSSSGSTGGSSESTAP